MKCEGAVRLESDITDCTDNPHLFLPMIRELTAGTSCVFDSDIIVSLRPLRCE